LDDLASLDPDLYQGLIFLKHYTSNLSLNFTVAVEGMPLVLPLYTISDTPHFPQNSGSTKTIDLTPDGNNVAVMREKCLQYIQLVSHYRLSK